MHKIASLATSEPRVKKTIQSGHKTCPLRPGFLNCMWTKLTTIVTLRMSRDPPVPYVHSVSDVVVVVVSPTPNGHLYLFVLRMWISVNFVYFHPQLSCRNSNTPPVPLQVHARDLDKWALGRRRRAVHKRGCTFMVGVSRV